MIKSNNITIAFVAVVMLFFFTLSCGEKKKEVIPIEYDPENVPSIITDSVVTLISDSGITRYRLEADVWEIYDKASEPFWFFPKGLYLEQFDSIFNVEATVKADTAWNYTNKRMWKLRGNVTVKNVNDESFFSQELFWDQKEKRFYSDKFIQIKRTQQSGEELKGFGFEANEQMTVYKVLRPFDGVFEVRDNMDSTDVQPAPIPKPAADSLQQIQQQL